MARSLKDLSKRCRQLSKDIPNQVNELAIKVALTVTFDLIETTPVDTSKALSSWKATRIAPFPAEVDAYFPGFFGYTAMSSQRAAKADAEKNIKNKKPGETIFIVNNADYITDLNNGTSRQAPSGFVQMSVAKGRQTVNKFKFKF